MMKIASALTGAARLLNRCSVPVLMTLALLGSMLSLNACGSNENEVPFPTAPVPEARKWLFDVYGTAANDVYVGGALGVMYHFDGTDWTLQNMGTSAAVTNIWAPPAESALYAVGHGGHIWRNTGSGWSGMSSGTQQDLYGIGQMQIGPLSSDVHIHAVGANGTIRRFNGSTWSGIEDVMVILDENGTPTDTLSVAKDLSSVLTVNHYFMGGAYIDPKFEGETFGINNTKGNVMAINTLPDSISTADWVLRPISGEQVVAAEWVLCTTSDAVDLSRNYLGTSEGWLFRLVRDDNGDKVWQKFYPELTNDPGAGIRDIWVDTSGDLYLVTDEGRVIFQTADYNFSAGTGQRQFLYDGPSSLVSIWGTGPDNIYFTGYYDEIIFHGVHDVAGGTLTVDTIDLPFPDKSLGDESWAPGLDEIGRLLRR